MTVGFQSSNPLPRDPNQKAIQGVFRTMTDGNATVSSAGTAVQLTATSTPCKRIDVTAYEGNAGTVVIGASTVVAATGARRGVALEPSNTYTFYPSDVSDVWVDAVNSGDKVTYVAFA